jgi:hypothetical protein
VVVIPTPGGEQLCPASSAAGAKHQLGGVDAARKGQQSIGDVGADHLVIGTSEVLNQYALAGKMSGVTTAEAVTARHVYRKQIGTFCARGDTRRPANQRFALGSTGQRHNHPLTGFPVGADLVIGAVMVELLVDLTGDPEERQLAQRGEIAHSEVVAEGCVDLVWRVDIAVRQSSTQRLRCHVNQLNLLRLAYYGVGNGLALAYAGDIIDNVIERLQVLHIHCRDDGDPRVEELLDVLPSLLVGRAGSVGMSKLVNEGNLGPSSQDRRKVHLFS